MRLTMPSQQLTAQAAADVAVGGRLAVLAVLLRLQRYAAHAAQTPGGHSAN